MKKLNIMNALLTFTFWLALGVLSQIIAGLPGLMCLVLGAVGAQTISLLKLEKT
jgi:hypothetical protein